MQLADLVNFISDKKKPVRLSIAAAHDKYLLEAVIKTLKLGLTVPIFIGNKVVIQQHLASADIDVNSLEIIDETDEYEICKLATGLVARNEADILCKGLVNTKIFMKEVLNRQHNLLQSELLSHLAIFETPYYEKLIGITDAALNILPDIDKKKSIITNAIPVFHKLNVEKPKVALLSASEKVNLKIQSSIEADVLKKWFETNNNGNFIVDGPLALDNAISIESARHKNIKSEVAGNADLLVVPNIESGNVLYKSLNFLGGAISASVVLGARVPIVLTSRSDTPETKFDSIALAASIL